MLGMFLGSTEPQFRWLPGCHGGPGCTLQTVVSAASWHCQDNKRVTYGSVEDARAACEGMGSVQCREALVGRCGWRSLDGCLGSVAVVWGKIGELMVNC